MRYIMEKEDTTCHHLYTMWAIEHLHTAVGCIEQMSALSNINMMDIYIPMIEAMQKKIYTKPHYKEAFDLLCKLHPERYESFRIKEYEKVQI